MTLIHPLAEEHPWLFADIPADLLVAFWNDSLYYADPHVRADDLAVLAAWHAATSIPVVPLPRPAVDAAEVS